MSAGVRRERRAGAWVEARSRRRTRWERAARWVGGWEEEEEEEEEGSSSSSWVEEVSCG